MANEQQTKEWFFPPDDIFSGKETKVTMVPRLGAMTIPGHDYFLVCDCGGGHVCSHIMRVEERLAMERAREQEALHARREAQRLELAENERKTRERRSLEINRAWSRSQRSPVNFPIQSASSMMEATRGFIGRGYGRRRTSFGEEWYEELDEQPEQVNVPAPVRPEVTIPEGKWKLQNNTWVEIKDMTDSHLNRCIKLIESERYGKGWRKGFLGPLRAEVERRESEKMTPPINKPKRRIKKPNE